MTRRKKTRSITVIGRKWFDRINGNTYHTATILVNGETVHAIPFSYGYGDMYLQSSWEWLAENGFVKPEKYERGGYECAWQYCERNGIALHYSATDVSRKRDL